MSRSSGAQPRVTGRTTTLSAWPGFTLPDLDGVSNGARTRRRETIDLDTSYFDTRELRLVRRGITLRHRRRGAREVWTLELPVGDAERASRPEREAVEVAAPAGAVPDELALLVAPHVRTESLARVARLATVRRRTVVDGPTGTFAEIADDEVSVLDGGRVAARFRELEVEVPPHATEEAATAIIERLCRAGAEPAAARPKLISALGPRSVELPELAPRSMSDAPTAAQVIGEALRDSLTRLIDHHVLAARGEDPEGVHQMRVGARRLRSDLRTFRPLIDRDVTDPLRDELKELGGVLGAVRDPDVLGQRLGDHAGRVLDPGDVTGLADVLARLDRDRDRAQARLRLALDSQRYRRLLDALVAVAEHPPTSADAERSAVDVLPRLVRKPWSRLRAEVDRLGDEPSDEQLHEVRKRAKQVRYVTEAIAGAVPGATRSAKGVKKVQSLLGDHQDTVEAEAWLRQVAVPPELDGAAGFVLGALVADERARRRAHRADWPAVWDKASDPDRWRWVR